MRYVKIAVSMLCTLALIGFPQVTAASVQPYMTYRDNALTLSAAPEIDIIDGYFQVNEFCITDGQDPNEENKVGQIHTLEDGQLHFNVGRSASQKVAEWFNQKFSGYNDKSINGDRTTFDHTAEDLNFAFVGDLNINVTTADNPQGISVSFPNVGIAQGSTQLRNNWWFGQLTGQHTLDSDGPNRVLVFGVDDSGNQVFASFLRGGNDVNEVTLCDLYVADDPIDRATTVDDVQTAFSDIPIDGQRVDLQGFPGNYDPTVSHIQGHTLFEGKDNTLYSILTHSVSTADYAHILAGPVDGDEFFGFKTYMKGWKHPGGIQTIGDYLLVPSEQDDHAYISLYDLRTLQVGELRRVETFSLATDHKVGAMGITSYQDPSGNEYYLLVAAHLDGTNSEYHIYRASAVNGIETADFQEVGSFNLDKDFQGFGLVTETGTNNVYMIGLWSPTEALSYADYEYLYQLNTENWSVEPVLSERHLISTGGAAGVLGVHFRYGAGVYVSNDRRMMISATERNSVMGSTLTANVWRS